MRHFYLTYAEPPSGVYSSQVIDVVNYLNSTHEASIRLVAFISLHDFQSSRARLKAQFSNCLVLPMLPKAHILGFNTFMLWLICLLYRPHALVARNVVAANMALRVKPYSSLKSICFDGRGAIAAEWHEYQVGVHPNWKNQIAHWEKRAVLESDFRIAVSRHLIDYWRNSYGYSGQRHVVIPCTLNSDFNPLSLKQEQLDQAKKALGMQPEDIVLAYSGSTAGWQSFTMLKDALSKLLEQSQAIQILFLSPEDSNIDALSKEYPGRVTRKWVNHRDVPDTLAGCDYGLLIREQSVTNRVASPTKFAEYLAAGLPVIASDGIGDYSDFIHQHQCGIVLAPNQKIPSLKATSAAEKARLMELVLLHFTKKAHDDSYRLLLSSLN